jgi:hypothetical protein
MDAFELEIYYMHAYCKRFPSFVTSRAFQEWAAAHIEMFDSKYDEFLIKLNKEPK